jgi:hypothetical protein
VICQILWEWNGVYDTGCGEQVVVQNERVRFDCWRFVKGRDDSLEVAMCRIE